MGLALACRLLDLGRRVLVIERQANHTKSSEQERLIALNKNAKTYLETIGCWQALDNQVRVPFNHMFVWDALSSGQLHLKGEDLNTHHLGFIVSTRAIVQWLEERINTHPNGSLIKCHITSLHICRTIAAVV